MKGTQDTEVTGRPSYHRWGTLILVVILSLPIIAWRFSGLTLLLIGSSIPTITFVWITLSLNLTDTGSCGANGKLRERFRPILFTRNDNWQREVSILQSESTLTDEAKLYPPNFLINDTLNNIVSLVIRDFVSSWFQRITSDSTFLIDIRNEIAVAVDHLGGRLQTLDFSKVLVHRLVPTLDDHLKHYARAREIVKNRKATVNNVSLASAKETDKAIAFSYNRGELHPAVKINGGDNERDIKLYLSDEIGKLLPLLLSESEVGSPPVLILVREILTSFVFYPIVSLLSDPDFYNQQIVGRLANIMKDRDDVKRFRTILNQHSICGGQNSAELAQQVLSRPETLQRMKITVKTSSKAFEKVVRHISHCDSLHILRQYRYLLTLQLNEFAGAIEVANLNVDESAALKTYSKRLQILLAAVDARSLALSSRDKSSSAEGIPITEFDPSTIPKNPDLTLEQTLINPVRLPYFVEFMENRNRGELVQFWISVNGLRNPLEDFYIDDTGDDGDTGYMNDDMSQADDLRQVFHQYFGSKLLSIAPERYDAVSIFVSTHPDDSRLYHLARRTLFELQKLDYERMEKTDFVAFRQSDFFIRMLAAGNQPKLGNPKDLFNLDVESSGDEVNGDPLAAYDEVDSSDEREEEKVSDTVLNAVEKALGEITKETAKQNEPSEASVAPSGRSASSSPSSRLLSKDLQKDLFGSVDDGEESGLFDYSSDGYSDRTSSKVSGMDEDMSEKEGDDYDDDESALIESGTESMILSLHGPSSEVRVAAPGDLNLVDEINKLGIEIDRLKQQLLIISTLLSKAELTSNTSELKILNKSKDSLEREVQLRELQRQQYTVQQSESSLFNRSKVSIQSYITAKEDGRDFVMYLIEVQRVSNDDPNVVVAGWLVARRFSQFYKLHKYLRVRHPEIGDLDFPKRKVVMKFQQPALLEERKRKLEEYLRKLICINTVCSDRVFRDFLSSDVFTLDLNDDSSSTKSTTTITTNLYNRIWDQLLHFQLGEDPNATIDASNEKEDRPLPGDIHNPKFDSTPEMRKELSILDEETDTPSGSPDYEGLNGETKPENFPSVRPLFDLMVTVFQLNKSKVWLGGRALVIILQQLLGSTIERVVRENVDGRIKKESNVFALLTGLQNSLWPNGDFRKHGKERTSIEKARTKQQARYMLVTFAMDSCSRIFGRQNSRYAAELTFDSLQNPLLNKHLALTLLGEVITSLFPEIENK
ncbi:DEKNAAC100183 [Brettanomyces naardenensis]|uniref:DEKNAAC100183 n=1 Tax=Brettanomyces naardenensis TaxID=13370 RepID=A0A448YEV4_BRENA|nr:DEKNAAC100183 [Brettanomyces naardenensis]